LRGSALAKERSSAVPPAGGEKARSNTRPNGDRDGKRSTVGFGGEKRKRNLESIKGRKVPGHRTQGAVGFTNR